jgi:hypothetical protein
LDNFRILLAFFTPANAEIITAATVWWKNEVDKMPKKIIKMIIQSGLYQNPRTSPATDVIRINPAGPNNMMSSAGNINKTIGNNILIGAL